MQPLAACLLTFAAWLAPCFGQATRDPLIGTVKTPDGQPAAGVKVEVWRAGGRGTGLLDLDYKNDFHRVGRTPTDRRGRFALQLPVGLSCRVIVDQPPFAVWLREDCLPGEDLTIQLQQPAVFHGTLTTADGRPATASLRAWSRTDQDEVFRGRTDDQSHFRFDRVAPGPLRVEIAPDAAAAPHWFDVDLESGQDYTHDVQLEPGVRLFGRITDRVTGKPIAGALIGEGWTLFRAVESDADGRYELRGYGSPGRDELHCVAPGYVKQVTPRPAEPSDPLEIDFQLEHGQTAAGRIVDTDGKPMTEVFVHAFGFVGDSPSGMHDSVSTRTTADGRFAVRGLGPKVHHGLVVRKDGYAMLVYVLPDAGADGVKQVGDLVLPKTRVVRGVLTDGDGKPIANARVSLVGYNADRDRLIERAGQDLAARWRSLDLYVGQRRSRTDQLGRFAFGDVPAGEFHVEALDARYRTLKSTEPFRVSAEVDPKPIELSVGR